MSTSQLWRLKVDVMPNMGTNLIPGWHVNAKLRLGFLKIREAARFAVLRCR